MVCNDANKFKTIAEDYVFVIKQEIIAREGGFCTDIDIGETGDYAVLNSFNISDKVFREVVFMYSVVNETNALEFKEKINEMLDTDLGFLYKETVYKVKK